jgi:hypothetical protein
MNQLITKVFCITLLLFALTGVKAGKYVFSVKGTKTFLNGQEIVVAGLRCSNALISEEATKDLISHLDEYKSYGVNTISVFIMGSRYGNFKGYLEDASLSPVYSRRMAKIIRAADKKGMIVVVGCLYWGGSTAKWKSWTQKEANKAVANTVAWLKKNDFRNVLVDVDNEGMAMHEAGFDPAELVMAAKSVDPTFVVATNFKGLPPAQADLGIHFSEPDPAKPYIETEGTPTNAPGGYWSKYSRPDPENAKNYTNIGVYSPEMKENVINITREYFQKGWGYLCASTWLQCVSPYGPNADPGGDGTVESPGIRWWLEALKEMRGAYTPPR